MATRRLPIRKVHSILRLHFEAGLSQRQIDTSQNIGYGTVANYLKRARQTGLSWPLPQTMGERVLGAALFTSLKNAKKADLAKPDFALLQQELKRKGMTLMLLWQEYREVHPDNGYSYSQFCHRYIHWLGTQKLSLRQIHVAGEKCFVDYAGSTVPVVNDDTGEFIKVQIFVAVLDASGYSFAHAAASQTEADWIYSYNAAFTPLSVPVSCPSMLPGALLRSSMADAALSMSNFLGAAEPLCSHSSPR